MSPRGKQKGNAYERKVAKELSEFMFNDKDALKRHPTSGADKCIWCGDIYPAKQLPFEWNAKFPFMIETKSGYKDHYPTFWSFSKLKTWFEKACLEGFSNNQNIIYLICQFKNKQPLLITNQWVDTSCVMFDLSFPIILSDYNQIIYGYVYLYKHFISIDFNRLYCLQEICSE